MNLLILWGVNRKTINKIKKQATLFKQKCITPTAGPSKGLLSFLRNTFF